MFASLIAALALTVAFLPAPAVVADAGTPPAARTAVVADGLPDAAELPIRIRTIAAGTAVEKRVLVGEATAFDLGTERVYVHVELHAAEPGALTMVWRRDGKEVQTVTLDVGQSKSWRTWSYRRVNRGDAGQWTVAVLDGQGRVLGEAAFAVAAGGR